MKNTLSSDFERVFGRTFSGLDTLNITFNLDVSETHWILTAKRVISISEDKIPTQDGKCVYSIADKKITENTLDFVYNLDNSYVVINGELAAMFAIYVLKNNSPYAYKAIIDNDVLMIRNQKSEPFKDIRSVRCLLKMTLGMPDALEKTIKTSPAAIRTKWLNDDVGLVQGGRKLPNDVNAWAVKQKEAKELVSLFKYVCEKEDGNNTVILMNYFKACIRIEKAVPSYHSQKGAFYRNIYEILLKDDNYSSKKLVEYLVRQSFFYNDFRNQYEEAHLMRDYVELAVNMGLPFERYPSNIRKAHNIMIKNSASPKLTEDELRDFTKECENAKKFEVTFKDFCVIIPKTPEDLLAEGLALNHCVAGYASRIARGETMVGFLRDVKNPETSLYTIEIQDNKVVHSAGAFNAELPNEMDAIIKGIERKWV